MVRTLLLLTLLSLPGPLLGHIGSPTVFFEGLAGPYPVRVVVRPPGVIPGLAEISVRVEAEEGLRVSVLPVHARAGLEGAPPADIAQPVRGEADLFSADLWLMERGAYSVFVKVEGSRGAGTAIVPVNGVATQRLEMDLGLGAILGGLGLLLFLGLLAIVHAAAREGTLSPSTEPDARRRRIAWFAAAAAAAILFLGLYGGRVWWNAVDSSFRRNLFRPIPVEAQARVEGAQRILSIAVQWGDRRRASPFIPDHGKLMHAFLVRVPALDGFAHIHPIRRENDRFEVPVPPLPGGTYRLYADVTLENGLSETLTTEVTLPDSPAGDPQAQPFLEPDPDDSWAVSRPFPEARIAPEGSDGGEGLAVHWKLDPPLVEGREIQLRFAVTGPDGKPAPLEPYMGMLGHAAVRRDDGTVFAHLHPVGTISMASQELFAKKAKGAALSYRIDLGGDDPHAGHAMGPSGSATPPSEVSFPYEFPRAGRYRLWVQTKSSGRVLTGVFDVEVRGVE